MWAILAIISAMLLGIYDVFKKIAVKENAVLPVLFFSILSACVIVTPFLVGSRLFPSAFQAANLYVPLVDLATHAKLLLKSVLVVSSWVFVFFAMKYLPITIVTPIRATGPFWTLIGALTLFGESLGWLQWLGLSITLIFFYLFSIAGKTESINFRQNKWILFVLIGTVLGAGSGLYDKHLMRSINRMAVQVYYTYYQLVVMLVPLALVWWPRKKESPFVWRWSIPLIAVFLLIADFVYFYALSFDDALISVVSALRRGGVLVSFSVGALVFKEHNITQKALWLAGILFGIILLILGS